MTTATKADAFTLPRLPYDEHALQPTMSGRTLGFHYGKHHRAYVDKLNALVQSTDYADMPLEEVMTRSFQTRGEGAKAIALFNNAAQAWNHEFFWSCLTPKSGPATGAIAKLIERDYGSYDDFIKQFAAAAMGQFGSGWVWLVAEDGKVAIEKTLNAVNPLAQGRTPLFTVDVWEHAYYLDYQNRRQAFVEAILKSIVNWDFVNANWARST